jgi:YbbR domain-containing protein
VRLEKSGEPAAGYDVGDERLAFTSASVTGPASAVERVSELIAAVSLASLKSSLDQAAPLTAIDADGQRVNNVTISPTTVQVQVPVTQKVGFRDVAVKPVVTGQIARGYRVTNIIVTPPIITVSSSDRDKVTALPGFVETEPLDITGVSDDLTQRLALVLPEGVFPTGEPTVLVQITIAAIEGSVQVQRPIEVQNLAPGLAVTLAPQTVDVLVSGPLPVLETLQSGDVRVIVNVEDLAAGTYTLAPEIILSRDKLRVDVIQPGVIEVVLARSLPATRTPSPTISPTPTRTRTPAPPNPTPTPTPRP